VEGGGQATVEQGFSINKQVETENLSEESVVAKRTICNYVTYVGGIEHVDVIKRSSYWQLQQLIRNTLLI